MKTKNEDATNKVLELRECMTDQELSALLCISRNTLYKRLTTMIWKGTELALIENLKLEDYGEREEELDNTRA